MKINFDPGKVKQITPQIKEKFHKAVSTVSEKVKITPEQAAAFKTNAAKLPANLKEKLFNTLNSLKK